MTPDLLPILNVPTYPYTSLRSFFSCKEGTLFTSFDVTTGQDTSVFGFTSSSYTLSSSLDLRIVSCPVIKTRYLNLYRLTSNSSQEGEPNSWLGRLICDVSFLLFVFLGTLDIFSNSRENLYRQLIEENDGPSLRHLQISDSLMFPIIRDISIHFSLNNFYINV